MKNVSHTATELIFILDRSGSMVGLETDTIGGFNGMIKRQKKEPGDVTVTTVLFDDDYELLHDRIPLKGIHEMTEKEYFVRGSTALLDAIGKTIHKIGHVQKHTAKEARADKVLFVITTDGMENASREYTYERIHKMIAHQKQRYGWEFLFLGANIDAEATAERFGIDRSRAATYHADSKGTQLNYAVVSEAVSAFRSCSSLEDNWKEKIDEDFKKRSK